MKFTQIEVQFVLDSGEANTWLRQWQLAYPKRTIININMIPADPAGWFMTLVYEMEV